MDKTKEKIIEASSKFIKDIEDQLAASVGLIFNVSFSYNSANEIKTTASILITKTEELTLNNLDKHTPSMLL